MAVDAFGKLEIFGVAAGRTVLSIHTIVAVIGYLFSRKTRKGSPNVV